MSPKEKDQLEIESPPTRHSLYKDISNTYPVNTPLLDTSLQLVLVFAKGRDLQRGGARRTGRPEGCHLDAAHVLWTHSVKANVLRKQPFKAKVLQTQSVKAKGIQTRLRYAIGNRVATVVASRRDYQTLFVSAKNIKRAVDSMHCD